MITKDTLKQWFKNGNKPPQEQFWSWMDSYFHKEEKIPVEIIEGINEILINKADKKQVEQLLKELENKADKELIEKLKDYVYNLIDDTLVSSAEKTYSIDKIRELTNGIIFDAVEDILYNAETGILTIEYTSNEPKEINLNKDNFLSNVIYNSDTKEIIFTMINGSVFNVNIKELVDTYETAPDGGLELINNNQFQIKEKGVTLAMLGEDINLSAVYTDENNNLALSKNPNKNITSGNNTIIGNEALSSNITSDDNTVVGFGAGKILTEGEGNTFVGKQTAWKIKKSTNSASLGKWSNALSIYSNKDIAIGHSAMYMASDRETYSPIYNPEISVTAGENVAIGYQSMYRTLRGKGNTWLGSYAGMNFRNFGEYNVGLGYGITLNTNHFGASNCVIIGANAPVENYESGQLVIHSQPPFAEVGVEVPLIKGNFKDRTFSLGGKYILNYNYTPDADKKTEEDPFIPTKILVADDNGNVGIKKFNNNLIHSSSKGLLSTPDSEISCDVGDYKFWIRKNSINNYASIGLTSLTGSSINTFFSYMQTYDATTSQNKTNNVLVPSDNSGYIMDNDLGYTRGGLCKIMVMNKENQNLYEISLVVSYDTKIGNAEMGSISVIKLS